MEISRDKAAGSGNASIRLRYSRHFESGGHEHTIDAEIALPVGASAESREQVIHELETGVEQLARQIVQRNTRPREGQRPPALLPLRAEGAAPVVNRTAPAPEPVASTFQRTTAPGIRTPVGESMPTTPGHTGEGKTIRLPDFIHVIKKYLNLSPQEAMHLLQVDTLDGLNFRDAYNQLQEIVKHGGGAGEGGGGVGVRQPERDRRDRSSAPSNEAARQTGKSMPDPTSRPPLNQATVPGQSTQTQEQVSRRGTSGTTGVTVGAGPLADRPERGTQRTVEAGAAFASSPKAPIPIQFGAVRDTSALRTYKFEEEEDEDEELLDEENLELEEDEDEGEGGREREGEGQSAAYLNAQRKLEELKGLRSSNLASAERLAVLTNIVDSQISEEQLQKLIQAVWGAGGRKKLKAAHAEALISWAKEDFFADEVEAMLEMLEQKGEEE